MDSILWALGLFAFIGAILFVIWLFDEFGGFIWGAVVIVIGAVIGFKMLSAGGIIGGLGIVVMVIAGIFSWILFSMNKDGC